MTPQNVQRYGVAVLGVMAAVVLHLLLRAIFGDIPPFLLFFAAIGSSAWYGGLGPGLATTALSAGVWLLWLSTSAAPIATSSIAVSLILFVAVGWFISYLTDAIERTRDAADAQRATLATTLLSIGDGIAVTDRENRVTLLNPVAEQLTGWTVAQAQGRPIGEVLRLVNEETRQPVESPLERVRRDGIDVGQAHRTILIARHGRECPIDESASPVKNADGQFDGGVLVFRDVTDRRRADAEREAILQRERAARMEAESANRIKDEFLATLSHELRTPLNAILGWARVLTEHRLDPDRTTQALQVIQRNAEAQARLITDLLDVSRFITGKMRLAAEPVDLRQILADAIDSVRVAAEAKQIAVSCAAADHLPGVMGDADRLRQLSWNLLTNALKFTPRNGRVTASLVPSDSHVLLQVSDTGSGIAADFLPHVFNRFTQADASASRSHGGLGLGLALVRQIAEAHGGSVQAHSDGAGRGATFTVVLPVVARQPDQPSTSSGVRFTPPVRDAVPSLGGVAVVVVEDDDDGRELAEMLLTRAGASVRTFATVEAALRSVERQTPDVIVTDLGMPDEDGFALIRRLRSNAHAQMPVIALTGYASPSDRARILSAGFSAHLVKPVDPVELAKAILDARLNP